MNKYQKDCKKCGGIGTVFVVDRNGAEGEFACSNKCWEWGEIPQNLPKADAYSIDGGETWKEVGNDKL